MFIKSCRASQAKLRQEICFTIWPPGVGPWYLICFIDWPLGVGLCLPICFLVWPPDIGLRHQKLVSQLGRKMLGYGIQFVSLFGRQMSGYGVQFVLQFGRQMSGYSIQFVSEFCRQVSGNVSQFSRQMSGYGIQFVFQSGHPFQQLLLLLPLLHGSLAPVLLLPRQDNAPIGFTTFDVLPKDK